MNSTATHTEPAGFRRSDAIALSVLLLIIAGAVAIRVWFRNWIVDYDLTTQFLPWYGFTGESIGNWDLPLWNPANAAGSPVAGVAGSGWMNIPIMVIFAIWSVIPAYIIYIAFLCVLAGACTYAFCRTIGLTTLGALTASVALAIGPFMYGAFILGQPNSQVSAFVPMGLLAVERSLRARRWPIALAWSALAAIAISQMFAGSVPRVMYGGFYVFGWLGWRALIDPVPAWRGARLQNLRRGVLIGAVIGGVTVGLIASALLPQSEILEVSTVAGADYSGLVGADYAQEPRTWSEIFSDHLSGSAETFYRTRTTAASVLVLVFAAVILARWRFGVPFFALLTVVFIDLTATGSVFRNPFYLFPPFEQVNSHRQSVTEMMAVVSIAVLAGIGVSAIERCIRSRQSASWLIAGLPMVGALLVLVVGTVVGASITWPQWALALITGGLVLMAVSGWHRIRVLAKPQVFATAILLILVAFPTGVDLVGALRDSSGAPDYTETIKRDDWVLDSAEQQMSTSDPGTAAEVLQYLQSIDPPFRYAAYTGTADTQDSYVSAAERRNETVIVAILANGRATRLGLEQISNYNPIQLEYYVEYVEAMNGGRQDYHYLDVMTPAIGGSQLLDMLNVRFILVPANLQFTPPIAVFGQEIYRDQYVVMYENPNAYDRAWIVHDVQPNNDGDGLALLATGDVDGHTTAFVDGVLPEVAPLQEGAAADWITWTDRSDSTLKFNAGTSQPGLAVVSMAYEAGWVAYVDGERTEVLRTNHALIGVPVTAGEHSIELRYEPKGLVTGLWISGVTAACVLVVTVWAAAVHFRGERIETAQERSA